MIICAFTAPMQSGAGFVGSTGWANKVCLYEDPDISCLSPIPLKPRPMPPFGGGTKVFLPTPWDRKALFLSILPNTNTLGVDVESSSTALSGQSEVPNDARHRFRIECIRQ